MREGGGGGVQRDISTLPAASYLALSFTNDLQMHSSVKLAPVFSGGIPV